METEVLTWKHPRNVKKKQQQKTPRMFLLTWKLLQKIHGIGDSELGKPFHHFQVSSDQSPDIAVKS